MVLPPIVGEEYGQKFVIRADFGDANAIFEFQADTKEIRLRETTTLQLAL